jgi:hypothetical protein
VRRVPGSPIGAAALAAVVGLLAGCSEDGPGDAARFCGEVQEHATELLTPPATLADVDGFLALYRRIGDVAPLTIEPHWQALVLNYETASTVDPTDPASTQRAYARAYQTEGSAVEVHDYLRDNCGVELGPVTTIVAHEPGTAAPASVPSVPPVTSAPGG